MIQEHSSPKSIIDELTRALIFGRVRNSSVFLSTGVVYPNGVAATVRIDQGQETYSVSDDGYATVIAEGMGALPVFTRIAHGVAQRSGISFKRGSFAIDDVAKSSLPFAVGVIANASARAMERVLIALEQPRIRRSRELFDKRLIAAYGDEVSFDVEFRGSTGRNWEFNAGVKRDGEIVHLFELVSPSTQSVAMANMKISDAKALAAPPVITAALVDYERTDPTLRAILSAAGGVVIAANDDISKYQLNAA